MLISEILGKILFMNETYIALPRFSYDVTFSNPSEAFSNLFSYFSTFSTFATFATFPRYQHYTYAMNRDTFHQFHVLLR